MFTVLQKFLIIFACTNEKIFMFSEQPNFYISYITVLILYNDKIFFFFFSG
jgi:hypothetical protein